MARMNWMKKKNKKRRAATRRQLGCEGLEDRRVLATLTVTSLADSGAGSLRDAIATSNTNGEDDTIVFDSSIAGGTVSLTSGELQIGETGYGLTITGSGETIDASGSAGSRVLNIDDGDGYLQTGGVVVNVSDVTITGGNNVGAGTGYNNAGGGVYNVETLNLTNVTISGNSSDFGGGIANTGGILTVTDSMIDGNSASYNGGALNAVNQYSEVTLTNTTVSGNSVGATNAGPYISQGGGVRIADGIATLSDSTISGNNADTTGSTYDYGGYGGKRSDRWLCNRHD